MALYHRATSTWVVAEDSTLSQSIANRSTTKTETADITEHVEKRLAIPDATTDMSISFVGSDGLTTAKGLLIITNQPISVKINGSATALPIGHTAGESATLMLDATAITALSVSNASGSVANVYISLPGA